MRDVPRRTRIRRRTRIGDSPSVRRARLERARRAASKHASPRAAAARGRRIAEHDPRGLVRGSDAAGSAAAPSSCTRTAPGSLQLSRSSQNGALPRVKHHNEPIRKKRRHHRAEARRGRGQPARRTRGRAQDQRGGVSFGTPTDISRRSKKSRRKELRRTPRRAIALSWFHASSHALQKRRLSCLSLPKCATAERTVLIAAGSIVHVQDAERSRRTWRRLLERSEAQRRATATTATSTFDCLASAGVRPRRRRRGHRVATPPGRLLGVARARQVVNPVLTRSARASRCRAVAPSGVSACSSMFLGAPTRRRRQ